MRIEIEIPQEFEEHFKQDKFEDALHRLSADAHLIAGNYEQETAIMLIKAFADSKPAYDPEKVVEELVKKLNKDNDKCKEVVLTEGHTLGYEFYSEKTEAYSKAIKIVRKGGAE